jgi:glycosyltransferase involved in cell wall biosynthesis
LRVLHIYSGNLFGGIETILLSLVRHRARGPELVHEFALCFDGRLASELRGAGASVHLLGDVRVSRPQTIRRARRALASHLAARRVDAVVCHAPWSMALFGPTVRRADVPLAFWAHDIWTGRHWTERWAKRVAPDLVIANSAFTASTLDSVYGGVDRAVVYAPIETASAPVSREERSAVRASFETADDDVVIVQASRMEAWKGHGVLLRALAALPDQPRWTCWIVGGAQRTAEKTYLESLRALAAQSGIADRVQFVGERTDVPRLLSAADIYCQPNVSPEPFGVVLIEALSAHLPVVTTALGGALEIVDESCGVLVDAGHAAACADALRRLVTDAPLRARLGDAGPPRARRLCDPAIQLRLLQHALHRAAGAALHA